MDKKELNELDPNGGIRFSFASGAVNITIISPISGDKLGEFKEVNNKLTFKGNVDEAGLAFVDFICRNFNARITELAEKSAHEAVVKDPFNSLLGRLEKCFYADPQEEGNTFDTAEAAENWYDAQEALEAFITQKEKELQI